MRTLAIDLGERRVGLAISDEGGRFATPLEVLEVSDKQQAVAPILKIVKDEAVQRIVLGLPLNMDGTSGPAALQAIAWSKSLAPANVPVIFVDERLSSFAAEQSLNERKRAGEKLTKKRRKQQLDAVAAAGFLQAFLDGRLPPIDIEQS
jgi:putative Holliday junction resolvase